MPKAYNLQNGVTISVSDTALGEGGEGAVFEILSPINYSESVCKILYPDKRTAERRYKIRHMVDNPPLVTKDENGHDFLIWPTQILLENGDFVGFVMPRAEGVDLEELCRVKLKPELDTSWLRFSRDNSQATMIRSVLCSNIAKAVSALHANGKYVIGDLKPENIRVKSNGLVSILDLDSCQITEYGVLRFQSKMNTPRYNPPEKISVNKDVSWDQFILGIIFYEILCGIHPFIGTAKAPFDNLNTPELKIQAGLFPFGSKSAYFIVIAPPHSNFHKLSPKIQRLFIKCFDMGITDVHQRPTTSEWISCLTSKPKLLTYSTDRTALIAGMEANITWNVEDAETIFISNQDGQLAAKGTLTVKPQQGMDYVLTATNCFGTIEETLSINIFPTPIIRTLFIPLPNFNYQTSISNILISSPDINLQVKINSSIYTHDPFKHKKDAFDISTVDVAPFQKNESTISRLFDKFHHIARKLNL